MLNRFFIFGLFLGIFFEAGQARNHAHYRFHQEREDFVCPEPEGTFPIVPGVCSVDYYLCLACTPYPQKCAGVDQVFDPSIGRCVSSSECNGSAPSSTTSTTCPTTTTTSGPTDATDTTLSSSTTTTKITTTGGPTTFECPTDDGFYPIPNYCGPNYFACVNGSPYVKTCPGDSYFDPITEVCTSQDLVTCLNPFQCPGDGFYAIPGVCSQKYYVCVAGTVTVSECPPGTLFEPDTLRCAPEAIASCKQPPTTTPSTTTTSTTQSTPSTTTTPGTTTPPAEFVCPGVGQYPYPDDCTKYYLCWTGGSLVATCPAGQVFNPETTFCDDPANVPGACGTLKYSDIFLRSTSLSCLDARGSAKNYLVIQDSKRCDQYYTCHKGESTYSHWRCRDNQLFDSTFKGCNFPEYVNCGTRSLP